MRTLALGMAALALASCDRPRELEAQPERFARYAIIGVPQGPVRLDTAAGYGPFLLDTQTGETWVVAADEAGKAYWAPLGRR